jgi:hypothetical protein
VLDNALLYINTWPILPLNDLEGTEKESFATRKEFKVCDAAVKERGVLAVVFK